LSPYLFAVYSDDLSIELNNTRAGCYIVEVLLNHLMFADDICIFCPRVRVGLQSILDVCQDYAKSHGNIFNCSKTDCMTFKTKRTKCTVIPLLTLGGQSVKYVIHYKCSGLYWIQSSQITKTETTAISILCSKQAARFFPDVRTQWKMYFFVPSVHPCMHHNYGLISGRYTSRDCVWPMILVAGLYTTCRGERVLVIRFNANIPTFEALLRKNVYLFLNGAKSLTTYGCALWCSQIVYIRPYSLNTTNAFYFVTERSDVTVSVLRMCAGHNAFVSHLARVEL